MKSKGKHIIKRAVFEGLEDRRMFSTTALSAAGTLTLQGDASTANVLSVQLDSRGQVVANVNGAATSYTSASVKSVRILGGAGNDAITAAGMKVAVYEDGGDGNDSMVGGAGNDTLLGGTGDDSIAAGDGNDLVRGGDGNDSLLGENGDDSVYGEAGDDVLVGGAGSNTLDGGTGTNTLDGVTGVASGTTATTTTLVRLTGTGIGTAGSWNNTGNTFAKALDGDITTYFDDGQGASYVGLDLGASPLAVTSVRFAPRAGLEWRMVGGVFQGSNDNSNWSTLYTVTAEPTGGIYTQVALPNTTAYRYVRYMSPSNGYGNIADVEFYGSTPVAPVAPSSLTATAAGTSSISLAWADNSSNETGFKIERSTDGVNFTTLTTTAANVTTYSDAGLSAATSYTYRVSATNSAGSSATSVVASATTAATGVTTPAKLTGTLFATSGSWSGTSSDTAGKAMDSSLTTYFDAASGNGDYVGLDLGSGTKAVVSSVRFVPRVGFGSRMVGGQFQGSSDGTTWTTLYTVTSTPVDGQYVSATISSTASFRYVRFMSPNNGYGNVAEVEFYGVSTSTVNNGSASDNSGTSVQTISTPTTPSGLTAAAGAGAVSLAWTDNATNETGFKIERMTGATGTWAVVGTVGANVTSYVDSTVAAGTTYTYRVKATNTAGDSSASVTAAATLPATVVGAPVTVISLMSSTMIAGLAIQANGLNTGLSSGSCVDAIYQWDFGDVGSEYNALTGWNVAHVYDTPGTYTVTLKVTDDQGRSATATANVTVTADTRKTIYVDSINGNDSNTGLTTGAAVKSAARAAQLIGDNTKLLFNRGGTYSLATSLNATYKNFTIGAYGTGNRPTLVWAGGAEEWWEMISGSATSSQNVMVQDLVMDGGATLPTGIAPRGVNFAIRNVDFKDLNTSINCAGNPTGLLVQDTTQAAGANVTDYWLWLQGTDAVVIGNTVGAGGMYACRTSGGTGQTITRALFAYNNLGCTDRSNLRVQRGSYVYATNNVFTGTGIEFGPLGSTDGLNDPNWITARTSYVVCESNTLTLIPTKYLRLSAGLEHASIRNNVVNHDSIGEAISVEGYDSMFSRAVLDTSITNNTIIDNSISGIGIRVLGSEHGAELTIMNNLFIAPNLITAASTGSADIWVNDSTMLSFRLIANNIWGASKSEGYVGAQGYVYLSGATLTNFITPAVWDSLSSVHGDLFQTVVLGSSTYQVTVSGVTAGSNLGR